MRAFVVPASLIAVLAAATLAFAGTAAAQDSQTQQNQNQQNQAQQGEQAQSDAPRPAITGREARIIRKWYGTETRDTRQRLPNGIEPNVYLNAMLPPSMRPRQLPQGLVDQLPQRPDHSYARVGNSIVLIEDETGIVRGLLRDAAG